MLGREQERQMVVVHAFKRWNHQKAEYDFSKFKRTEDGIKACRGVLIPDTEEKIDQFKLDFQGRYDPKRWINTAEGQQRG
jgi:hypothetical protein